MENILKQSWFPCFWLAYLGLISLSIGLRWEHALLISCMIGLYLTHQQTRRWVIDFFPFALFGILYDLLRIFPKDWAGAIHIESPYRIEAALFEVIGFHKGFIPTNYFMAHNNDILDIITGAVYAAHVVIPIGFALYLWIRRSPYFNNFRWAFLFMNLFAFIAYIAYPSAPPWYVATHGFAKVGWAIPGSAAGLIRFDNLIGFEHFQNTYARSAWVFGAIPSMHAAFPLLVACYAHRIMGHFRWCFHFYAALAAFAAVYLNHHYFIDVLAGWGFALVFYFTFKSSNIKYFQ